MGIFRFLFGVVALIAIATLAASLVGGAASAGLAALGALVFLPIILFKGFLLLMLFGFFGRMAFGRFGRPSQRWDRSGNQERVPSAEDRFEEWHRMAHAREEVDSWTPEM